MTTEIRYIFFSDDEVVEAVKLFFGRNRQTLPTGRVARVSLAETAGDVTATLSVDPDEGGPARMIVIERERLAAALILHCLDKKVPLPLKAPKICRVLFGQATLLIGMGYEPPQFQRIVASLAAVNFTEVRLD